MVLKEELLTKPAWLPDWTDESNYPAGDKVAARAWAWEFLRRNIKYQQLWDKLMSLPKPSGFLAQESFAETKTRIELNETFEREFGVRIPETPSMGSSDAAFERRPQFIDQHVRFRMKRSDSKDDDPDLLDEVIDDPADVIVWFNLRYPIPRQVKAAELLLKEKENALLASEVIQNSNKKIEPERFRDYLRILDATVAGVAPKEVAEKIFGIKDEYPEHSGQQRVSNALKRATWFRDEGYRYLIGREL